MGSMSRQEQAGQGAMRGGSIACCSTAYDPDTRRAGLESSWCRGLTRLCFSASMLLVYVVILSSFFCSSSSRFSISK